MLEHTELYIEKCKEIGILTEDKIRKYPLRDANLVFVLKAFAIDTNRPFTIHSTNFDIVTDHELYLTDGGLAWLFDFFGTHSYQYLKSVFSFVFTQASEKDITDFENYQGYSNFKGLTGVRPKAGTKQRAVLVHTFGPVNNKQTVEYKFNNLNDARTEVLMLTRYYPIEEFTLYRIRKLTKRGKVYYYRNEIPLFLEESKRGMNTNLPHLRR